MYPLLFENGIETDADYWPVIADNGIRSLQHIVDDYQHRLKVGLIGIGRIEQDGGKLRFPTVRYRLFTPDRCEFRSRINWSVGPGESILLPDQVSVHHGLHACSYHILNIACAYAACSRETVSSGACLECLSSSVGKIGSIGSVEMHFEIESLFYTIIRTTEYLKKVIWRCFGDGGRTPKEGLTTTVSKCSRLSEELRSDFERLINGNIRNVSAYRRCITHYDPSVNCWPRGAVDWVGESGVKISVFIPDDPTCRDAKLFTYAQRIDALTFGWHAFHDLVNLIRAVDRYADGPKLPSSATPR